MFAPPATTSCTDLVRLHNRTKSAQTPSLTTSRACLAARDRALMVRTGRFEHSMRTASDACCNAVVASEKGIVVGRLTFREDGDLIDCSKVSG